MRPISNITESWDSSLTFWLFIILATSIPLGFIAWSAMQ